MNVSTVFGCRHCLFISFDSLNVQIMYQNNQIIDINDMLQYQNYAIVE